MFLVSSRTLTGIVDLSGFVGWMLVVYAISNGIDCFDCVLVNSPAVAVEHVIFMPVVFVTCTTMLVFVLDLCT